MIDRLPDGEYYDSADELIEEDDIIETDVKIAGWNKKFRIRALDFEQMGRINKNSVDKESGELDNEEWTYQTIAEGVIRPRFKIEKARKLSKSNGEFVKALADEIWNLGRISKPLWEKYIAEIKASNALMADKLTDKVVDDAEEQLNKAQ